MQNKISVLAFGHIPKFRGGRQQSGLANAMWALATNINDVDNGVDVIFCATDIRKQSATIDGLPVIGWTRMSLLLSILKRPLQSLRMLVRLARSCRSYEQPFLRTSAKAFLLRAAVDQVAPDYIHLHTCESVVYLEAGIVDGAKTLVTIHGVFGTAGPPHHAAMESALTRIPSKVLVFVTQGIAHEWYETFGAPQGRVAVVSNAYDNQEFFRNQNAPILKGGDKNCYRLVSIGSVCDNKGQARVVEALARFSKMGAKYTVQYTMVGKSFPASHIERVLCLASAVGITVQHIPYLSPSELRELLWQSDYMILATSNEGFGIVFLESIACGTPVVLPRQLPICREPDIISQANAVLLESSSADAVLTFLRELPKHSFVEANVAASIPELNWNAAGCRYRDLLQSQSAIRSNVSV